MKDIYLSVLIHRDREIDIKINDRDGHTKYLDMLLSYRIVTKKNFFEAVISLTIPSFIVIYGIIDDDNSISLEVDLCHSYYDLTIQYSKFVFEFDTEFIPFEDFICGEIFCNTVHQSFIKVINIKNLYT
jgi:hypothetical protein